MESKEFALPEWEFRQFASFCDDCRDLEVLHDDSESELALEDTCTYEHGNCKLRFKRDRSDAILLAVSFVASLAAADESDVVTLTSKNLDEVVAKEKLFFVNFFAPWFGHCQSMTEEVKKTATELKS
ncbi:Hypothetical protein CHC_T00009443001 [Chondrus crispus]|uniref:protein disulfide-isomerase n=1 Tax=Chondrus crispus TaxID=2769 RepID=R7QKA8_CHOCR|nr:Hypothetical protein CHC_T00009443001 [Chondrus crispus]CDF38479.1 Hypothetical protein CHC_T00009443001 [Chondrus crispus]|eukprot:XP_005718372.1 Hypothetical protein CHC_T00009443001 [Chondrus crispus]